MASKQTPHLKLNDWVGTDPFRLSELSENNRILDNKHKELDTKMAETIQKTDQAVTNATNATTAASQAAEAAELATLDASTIAGRTSQRLTELEGVDAVQFKGRQDEFDQQLADTESDVSSRSVNVLNFPIIAPEATDDARIQRAINKAEADGGKVVFIPAGTYSITKLLFKNRVSIVGAGRSNTVLNHSGTLKAFSNEGGSFGRISLSDFTLNMSETCPVGIDFSRIFGGTLARIDVNGKNPTGIAVKFDEGNVYSSYYNTAYDISINGYSGTGIGLGTGFYFANSANSTRIHNCRTNYVDKAVHIAADYTNNVVFNACAFEQFTTGVEMGGTGCFVAGCRFENAGGSARGTGITNTGGSNSFVGNFYTNILTPFSNPSGSFVLRLDNDTFDTKYLRHDSTGGWTTNMDMRNFAILKPGYVNMQIRTSAPGGAVQGGIAYADGTTWAPYGGGAEGLFVKKADGKWVPATQIKVSAIPTAGTWQRGEILYNSAPAPGGYVGWVCTAAGTPGTWKGFGLIEA